MGQWETYCLKHPDRAFCPCGYLKGDVPSEELLASNPNVFAVATPIVVVLGCWGWGVPNRVPIVWSQHKDVRPEFVFLSQRRPPCFRHFGALPPIWKSAGRSSQIFQGGHVLGYEALFSAGYKKGRLMGCLGGMRRGPNRVAPSLNGSSARRCKTREIFGSIDLG